MSPFRLRSASLLAMLAIGILFLFLVLQRPYTSHFVSHPYLATNSTLGWGIATRTFVISLPKRSDRRASLRPLWRSHRLDDIQYIDAINSEAPEMDRILSHVRRERRREHANDQGVQSPRRPSFRDGLGRDVEELWGSDWWTLEPPLSDEDLLDPDAFFPITAEQGNPFNPHKLYEPTPTVSATRSNNVLSRAMVACWYSHLQAIRQIAISGPNTHKETYIILEDDVDFEWNIESFLVPLWSELPNDWELVMLGHCWSNEARHSPIFKLVVPSILVSNPKARSINVSLHPSNSPLCTHAYALSPRGAVNLYNHLRHPAFAYSRALDQAIAWLIRSGNLRRAYSVVPSLVIQTKDSESDISERKGGSRWKDRLIDSTRQRLRKNDRSRWWNIA